jgi:hypothetical protein
VAQPDRCRPAPDTRPGALAAPPPRSSKQRPKRLTLYLSDFSSAEVLAKGGEDLRLDQRVMAIFGACNALAAGAAAGLGALAGAPPPPPTCRPPAAASAACTPACPAASPAGRPPSRAAAGRLSAAPAGRARLASYAPPCGGARGGSAQRPVPSARQLTPNLPLLSPPPCSAPPAGAAGQAAGLAVRTYGVAPISPQLGLVEFVAGAQPLDAVLCPDHAPQEVMDDIMQKWARSCWRAPLACPLGSPALPWPWRRWLGGACSLEAWGRAQAMLLQGKARQQVRRPDRALGPGC